MRSREGTKIKLLSLKTNPQFWRQNRLDKKKWNVYFGRAFNLKLLTLSDTDSLLAAQQSLCIVWNL